MLQVDKRNLSLMLFPQSWSGTEIAANILVLPSGDPTAAVGSELPFAQAEPVLRAAFLPGFATPSWAAPPPGALVHSPLFHLIPPGPEAPGLIQPAQKQAIFAGLAQQFTPAVQVRAATSGGVKKDLPQSYQAAAGFGARDPGQFTTGDGYGCDIRGTTPNTGPLPARPPIMWGEIFSYALRQPLIAQAIGMTYFDVRIPLPADKAAEGGWLWVEVDTSDPANWYAQLVKSSAANPYYEQPVRSYAARIPALTGARSVFAAVLFPVFPTVPTATSTVIDPAQFESDVYSTGFAQITHAYQPISADAIVGNDNSLVPGTDAGFQIGWDDEQVTIWLDRQVKAAVAMATKNPADEFPIGVQGYRVDARVVPDGTADPASTTPRWKSLVTVNATVTAGDSFTAAQVEEVPIEPTPVSNGGSSTFWLPRYFAHWRGRSLVVADKYGHAFGAGDPPKPYPQNPAAPQFSGSLTEVLDIELNYGNWYQFRARLTDLTGGGPTPDDDDPGAGVATIQFLRYVPPKAVGVTLDRPGNPATVVVKRPRLNYPEMVFARAATGADLDTFLAEVQAVTGTPPIPSSSYPSVSMPDPDVVTLEVIVEAQAPKHDTGNPASMQDMVSPPQKGDLDGTFRVVYRREIPFTGDSISLTIDPQAISDIVPWTPPSSPATTLAVPAARNLRIRLRGLGNGDPAYWGSTLAATGITTDLQVRYEPAAETGVIANAADPAKLPIQLQAFYLREDPAGPQQAVTANAIGTALKSIGTGLAPGLQKALALSFQSAEPTPIQRLAQSLNLPVNGMTLTAPPGTRVLFGAQSTLRHTITQDGSSITFSSIKDLVGHWIVVIRLTLQRDWTWTGLAQSGSGQTGFLFSGAFSMIDPSPVPVEIGRVFLPGVVSAISTEAPVNRDQAELIFFATVDSTVGPGQFPKVTNTTWSLSATFTAAPKTPVTLWSSGGALQLPITLPPRQTPKLVSAGVAESQYLADAKYSSTEQRQRSLWLEFDSPPADDNDEYFYRILGYGPDPLLVSNPTDLPAQTEPPLPVDPEWMRMIAAGDSNDDAGAGAMTPLDGATAPLDAKGKAVHYRVPAPDTIPTTDLQLFGFWTIELRVGHKLWSTAQARYGRALRVSGVQFPCPPLAVNADRQPVPPPPAGPEPSIVAVADLAQTVYNGVSLTLPFRPQTEIWYLLYAQVQRVDGQAWRNILLARVRGRGIVNPAGGLPAGLAGQPSMIPVYGVFPEKAVAALLKQLGLPPNTPLSVLAVELFNREADVIPARTFDVAGVAFPGAVAAGDDPLGVDLGDRRVLRVSPLSAVRPTC